MKRIVFIGALVFAVVSLSAPCHGQAEIVLDHVTNLFGGDSVSAGCTTRFTFRLTYITRDGTSITGSTNGFRVWTHRNGFYTNNFDPITYDTLSVMTSWLSMYDGGFFFGPAGVDGLGEDTVGFGGFRVSGTGIPDGFDQPVWYIETVPYQDGDTICIDSSFYPPANSWLISTNGKCWDPCAPAWYGPYCFVVIPNCVGSVGNVDLQGSVDMADLTFLIYYLFFSGQAPACGAGDMDDSGEVNVGDLTYLIDYLFRGGPAPPPCP